LPAELEGHHLSSTKMSPEKPLGIGRIIPELLCEASSARLEHGHGVSLPTPAPSRKREGRKRDPSLEREGDL
jgi:hypothetical protein